MSIVNSLKDFFSGANTTYQSNALSFPQLDVEKLKTRFRLIEEGEKRGEQNLPPSDSKTFDDVEQQIVSFIESEIQASNEAYFDNQRSFEDRINKLDSVGFVGKIEGVSITAQSDFKKLIHEGKDRLYTARSSITENESYLKSFREENGLLNRPARYPHSKAFYAAIIFFLITIETIVNGQYFAKGHEMGMVGGFFTAFIPSLLNVFLGWCLGSIGFKFIIHKNKAKQIPGIIVLLVVPVFILTLNLLIAHYRSAMTDLDSDAAQTALISFLNNTLTLKDVDSWLLVMIGSVCSLIAAIDFFKMDDIYPGYGSVFREREKKVDEYNHLKSDALHELEDIRNHHLEELDETYSLLASKYNEASTINDSQKRWSVLFQEHLNHLESAGKVLLATYRNANISKRTKGSPAPKHFLQEWKLKKPAVHESTVDFKKVLNSFKSGNSESQNIYADCLRKIGLAYDTSVTAFQTIEQLNREEFDKWLEDTTVLSN